MHILDDEQDDLVYGADGFALDAIPQSWIAPAAEDTSDLPKPAEPLIPVNRLLTATEAAAYVGCHVNTIYLAASSGQLQCGRVGRIRRFTIADLDAWTRGES